MSIDEEPITPIDWTKPIETEDGLPARLISDNYRYDGRTLMLVQIDHPDRSIARTFLKSGSPYWFYEGKIRNRKTKREGWVSIFPDRWAGMIWESKEDAQRHGDTKRAIDIVKIEWEE